MASVCALLKARPRIEETAGFWDAVGYDLDGGMARYVPNRYPSLMLCSDGPMLGEGAVSLRMCRKGSITLFKEFHIVQLPWRAP